VPGHVRQVRRIAGWLYDELRPYHGLGDEERVPLLAAALLHDVGYPTDPASHHKVSARIVRAQLGPPFTAEQVDLIALLARYHRKAVPKLKHRRYAALGPDQQRVLCWLGGVLRVADGLDRAHDTAVRAIQVVRPNGRVEVRAEGASDEDVQGAMRKRDLLERSLGMAVLVRSS
jgi:exopolyphosphatase/guanosine-5'-triphosphate,3'-diphosphate pyrophosphatase